MEVQLPPGLQARLDELVSATGRSEQEFVLDAMAGYFDDLAPVSEMLDGRYDDIKSGKVRLLDGEEAFSRLRAKSEARRNDRS